MAFAMLCTAKIPGYREKFVEWTIENVLQLAEDNFSPVINDYLDITGNFSNFLSSAAPWMTSPRHRLAPSADTTVATQCVISVRNIDARPNVGHSFNGPCSLLYPFKNQWQNRLTNPKGCLLVKYRSLCQRAGVRVFMHISAVSLCRCVGAKPRNILSSVSL